MGVCLCFQDRRGVLALAAAVPLTGILCKIIEHSLVMGSLHSTTPNNLRIVGDRKRKIGKQGWWGLWPGSQSRKLCSNIVRSNKLIRCCCCPESWCCAINWQWSSCVGSQTKYWRTFINMKVKAELGENRYIPLSGSTNLGFCPSLSDLDLVMRPSMPSAMGAGCLSSFDR